MYVTHKVEQPRESDCLALWISPVPYNPFILGHRSQYVHLIGFSDQYIGWLTFGFEREVDEMPGRSILRLIVAANIIGPSGRLHEEDEAMISDGDILHPCLPLVRIPRMFL